MGDMNDAVVKLTTWILPALLAITLHEAAHGLAADRLGDSTARMLGRVSLNPLRHVDPFGTVILPAALMLAGTPFLFGWAKPVPVNFRKLRNPRRDMVLVAAAGPAMNLLLAVVGAVMILGVPYLPDWGRDWSARNLGNLVVFNVILAVFNLWPIPPLDGGRIAVGLLPYRLAAPLARVEPFGFFIVLGLVFLLPTLLRTLGIGFDPAYWLISVPSNAIINTIVRVIAGAAGLG
jgi:Zn-dependent protease